MSVRKTEREKRRINNPGPIFSQPAHPTILRDVGAQRTAVHRVARLVPVARTRPARTPGEVPGRAVRTHVRLGVHDRADRAPDAREVEARRRARIRRGRLLERPPELRVRVLERVCERGVGGREPVARRRRDPPCEQARVVRLVVRRRRAAPPVDVVLASSSDEFLQDGLACASAPGQLRRGGG